MKLTSFQHNGLNLLIRDGLTSNAERDIVREVYREYPWDFPIETAIDIGAHIGAWTCAVKQRHPNARVVACEVDPQTMQILEFNVNGLRDVHLVHGRAGYGIGQYTLVRHAHNSGSTSVCRDPVNIDNLPLAPGRVTLEDLITLGQFERVDVLKLDCEGCEIDLLQHCTDDTLMRIDRVIGEIHMTPVEFEAQTACRLQKAGFHVEYRGHPGDPHLFYIHAWRDTWPP